MPEDGEHTPTERSEEDAVVNAEDGNQGVPEDADASASKKKPLKFKDPLELDFLAKLPHEITLRHIPNLNELRSLWRLGMNDIERAFQEHIQRMNMEFEQKTVEFDDVNRKIQQNYDFLSKWYIDMQRKLNEKNDLINQERLDWEKDKGDMAELVNLDSEVIPLNVGGTHHLMTERDVLRLCKGSILEKMFSGNHELKKIDGEVFLDRDGKTFLNLVNYLRNDREVFPEFMDKNDEIHFFKELDFWKIPTKYPVKGGQIKQAQNQTTYVQPK
jgi:hypothetical protein